MLKVTIFRSYTNKPDLFEVDEEFTAIEKEFDVYDINMIVITRIEEDE